MHPVLEALNINGIDSGVLDLNTPHFMLARMLEVLGVKLSGPCDEELQLRLIANAIIAANLLEGEKRPAWLPSLVDLLRCDIQSVIDSSLLEAKSGVLATNINGWLSIQLPRIESEEESQEVMSVLNDLQERHPGTAHWVVDLASSSYCPVSLLAYLVGLKQSIQPRAAKMTLLWLRSDAIPEPLAEAITSNFKLMRKGSYLISKIN